MADFSSAPDQGAPQQLQLRSRVGDRETILELVGDLDIATARLAADEITAITARKPRRLIIDLTGLEFMDSSGLSVLVGARNGSVAEQIELALRVQPGQVERLLVRTGLSSEFSLLS